MLACIGWLVTGLVVGVLARFLVPGRQGMGLFATIMLGLLGSMLGGFLSSLIWHHNLQDTTLHPSGLIMSTIGAVIILVISLSMSPRAAR